MDTTATYPTPVLPAEMDEGTVEQTRPNQLGDEDRLLTAEDIAKYFQVKPKTIYNWADQGLIPCYRITNRILRFDLEKVKKWFKGFEQPGRKPYKSAFDRMEAAKPADISG